MKKQILALLVVLLLLGGCSWSVPSDVPAAVTDPALGTVSEAATSPVRVSMLKGPTGLGAAKLMAEAEAGECANPYTFQVMAEAAEAVAALTKGETDLAALPTNLAAILYHKLDGGVRLCALNTGGVLYILENGDTVHSLEDLRGRTLHAFGQGANPEFILNTLLSGLGLKAGEDVDVRWYATADEVSTAMASGMIDLCMLPVPASTAVLARNPDVRSAVSLDDVWREAGLDGLMTMGCVVVRSRFAEENPEAVDTFLREYRESIAYMSNPASLDDAAALAERYGVVPSAAVARLAIPDARLCFMTGDGMIDGIQGYYQALFATDPASIGGSIPDGAFYYTSKG